MKPISEHAYNLLSGVRWSALREMRRSPKHYLQAISSRKETGAFRLGRATHAAILEPERFVDEWIVYSETKQRKGPTWEAFAALHDDIEILTPTEMSHAEVMADAVREHGLARELIADAAEIEIAVEWDDPTTLLPCKARLDLITKSGCKVEIKTTRAIEPKWFGADVARYGYHSQDAFHADGYWGVKRINGEALPDSFRAVKITKHLIIAIENTPPHDVAIYELDAETIDAGRRDYEALLARVAECVGTDTYPGVVPDGIRVLELPAWATAGSPVTLEIDGAEVSL